MMLNRHNVMVNMMELCVVKNEAGHFIDDKLRSEERLYCVGVKGSHVNITQPRDGVHFRTSDEIGSWL